MSTFTPISYASSDALALYARDYPATGGPARLPVICIHGLTRNSADFDELAPLLAAMGRRTIAVDVRGRGNSARDPNPANYNPVVYAGDIIKLMDQLGIARAVFIGTSMGGLITMTLAARRLDLIAAAILNDVGPILSVRGLQRIAGYAGRCGTLSSWDEAAAYLRDINACAFPANSDEEWGKWARRAFEQKDDGQLALRYDPNIATAIQTGKQRPTSLAARMAFRRLARRRPTLLVRGALSDLVEAEQADWMRKAAPELHYAEVPDVGHAPMLTEPAALDAIRQFLAKLP
ncbi:alpha/beta fold hydrolase [Massilia yuzhufengensis]|uniref:Pimeloyl-ACP methyl ester carboxylesterase n=1 Tax=Massilia yuzhufengensis TaxID=1164594 RepID=A0A1I1EVQ1_9BURK|nr:alpha/beta hydrolase [Massilia yuzhufengensis]SFB90772.1 Pimeloyl-ACP methyl ester carboxylesterase [Massilia yuzhufengensis]